ncbi:M28 family peptidase [Aquimarina sp. U1-2]|uniref:M28 family peptidase n=1 Tax=Aquimarina sp. U1-2 TaxID=2823141 RepID=UPI001AECD662|nr:M28 family peptidase [Aquimarina sp. U1-2]MBP2833160.1 M28 family peptidase [Aquimarina sp. U1-2]
MRKFPSLLTFILIVSSLLFTFYSTKSHRISDLETPPEEFSTLRALQHVKNMAKEPHYLGSPAHEEVRQYIVDELRKMGLQPEVQEGVSVSKAGRVSRPKNIIARIKGNSSGKSLAILSHYDSSPHSSYGASDAASGVATILEGIRAYLSLGKVPKNDIIICITDGEELGLNGADFFVKKHPYAKNIGLALNFEARGSGGDSYMLLETNGKNAKMINTFANAGVQYPVTNSLAYSIYKMLPNDTDLTVLREQANIDGFNFAFIGDHYDYHTANDIWQRLDLNTLQHQGNYLMPLLTYFSETDINNLKSDQDYIYFNTPVFKLVMYPFSWIIPLLVSAILFFLILLFYGRTAFRIDFKQVLAGFGVFLFTLLLSGIMSFGLWKLILLIYPQYNEIQHGFTYNGYQYIAAFLLLTIGICFKMYGKFVKKTETLPSLLVAPLTIWLITAAIAAFYLKGASYFIIIVFFGLISLIVLIRQKRPNPYLMVLLSLPAIFIVFPFITSFPVALGLKILFVSSLLTVMLFGIMLPVFGFYKRKHLVGNVALFAALIFMFSAHLSADFTEQRQKPNSLIYTLDANQNQAFWATYDKTLDSWTKNYIKPKEDNPSDENKQLSKKDANKAIAFTLQSKYGKAFTYRSAAPVKNIARPIIEFSQDTVYGETRSINLCIAPQRNIQRMDLYTATLFNFKKLKANGETAISFTHKDGKQYNAYTKRWNENLITYLVSNNEPLELAMEFHKDSVPNFILYETSYDLLENKHFSVPERDKHMMPKPFIVNDAVVVTKKFAIPEYQIKRRDTTTTEFLNTTNKETYAN